MLAFGIHIEGKAARVIDRTNDYSRAWLVIWKELEAFTMVKFMSYVMY